MYQFKSATDRIWKFRNLIRDRVIQIDAGLLQDFTELDQKYYHMMPIIKKGMITLDITKKMTVRVEDFDLIAGGRAVRYWGSRQFSQYLKVDDSFIASNFTVSGGTESEANLRTGDYLEVVEFSDFQCDSVTGDIAGEIRLAYLHQNGKVTPVSGGSVSGSMPELAKAMRFSRESRQYNCHLIPAVTRLCGATVTGAE